jgi:hypothetical protein
MLLRLPSGERLTTEFYADKFKKIWSFAFAPLHAFHANKRGGVTVSQNGQAAQFDDPQPQDISLISLPVSRLDNPTDQEQATVLHGQEAWDRLRHGQTWEDWKRVGAAHLIGRSRAMHEAGVNRPVGHRYNAAFAAWLKKFGFQDLDKGDRYRLFVVMDHLQEIETWRATLTPTERLRLNHPSAALRKWRSAIAISGNQNCRLSPIEKCRQETSTLKQEIFRLRRECERFGGDLWDPADRPEDIATVMVAKLSKNKAAAVANAILKVLKGKTQA